MKNFTFCAQNSILKNTSFVKKHINELKNCTIRNSIYGEDCIFINSTLKNCIIYNNCKIIDSNLEDCIVYNNSTIIDSKIYNKVIIEEFADIKSSYIYESVHIGCKSKIGPFSHIHNNCDVDGCRIGNFVEIKNSSCGQDTKIAHLSYIGDAEIGADVNIGAGTIICNYDGKKKHHTKIGSSTFIGSNTLVIAPRTIGAHCKVGAGSVVDKDLEDGIFYLMRSANTKTAKNRDYMG